MTHTARQLIDSFDALSEEEQRAVLAQLLRRLMDTPYPPIADDEFTDAADLVFQEYDRRET